MKRWQGSCIGALLVLVIGGSSLLFVVPVLYPLSRMNTIPDLLRPARVG